MQSLALFNLSEDQAHLTAIQTGSKQEAKAAWQITEANIWEEFDRLDCDQVSFYFVLRWIRHEIALYQSGKQYKADHLLSKIIEKAADYKQDLSTVNQLLAMCYFQYLESNQFQSAEKNYFYGELLELTGTNYEESVLVLLEMLRILFPAGNSILIP